MLHFLIFLVCVYVFVLICKLIGWRTSGKIAVFGFSLLCIWGIAEYNNIQEFEKSRAVAQPIQINVQHEPETTIVTKEDIEWCKRMRPLFVHTELPKKCTM